MAYPSTFLDIQNKVIKLVRLDSTADLSDVKDWINETYFDACVNTEANAQVGTMTTTANVSSYTLPTGVSRIKQMYVTPVGAIQSAPMELTTLHDILRKRRSSGGAILGGYITHYALVGMNDFEVYPTPASSQDTLTIYYIATPTALSADGDSPIIEEPFASRLLIYGAAAKAAEWRGDPSGSDYDQKYLMWQQKYRAHLTRKQGGQPGQFKMYPGTQFPPHDPSTDTGS